jgi:hypothetical protein
VTTEEHVWLMELAADLLEAVRVMAPVSGRVLSGLDLRFTYEGFRLLASAMGLSGPYAYKLEPWHIRSRCAHGIQFCAQCPPAADVLSAGQTNGAARGVMLEVEVSPGQSQEEACAGVLAFANQLGVMVFAKANEAQIIANPGDRLETVVALFKHQLAAKKHAKGG